MSFTEFRDEVRKNFNEMSKGTLFEVELDKDDFWNTYLDSFPAGTNEIYRVRREYDCSCCRNFIKNIGRVVSIHDGAVKTVWDVNVKDDTFQTVANALSEYVKKCTISNVFLTKFREFGNLKNFGEVDGKTVQFEHFYADVPDRFVHTSRSTTIDTVRGQYKSTKDVFKRSLDELSLESIETVLELIGQNSLYKGEEWKSALMDFRKHKKAYMSLDESKKDLYAWENSVKVGPAIGRIRNHSIGTLLIDITEGEDLDVAVRKYEAIVAPSNYKRPKAIFTQKMLDDAKKTITDLGYLESLGRRFATLDDIRVNNILFSNRDSAKRIAGAEDIFSEMSKEVKHNPKKFSKVEEISVEKFVEDVLPTASELEVYLENKHIPNMVSLIAPKVGDSPTMFKWGNGFSWAYSGNVTDSMKARVKAAGGKVDGDLRFSIQWNEEDRDNCDMDAHCTEPNNHEIYYGNKRSRYTKGQLDVDIINPNHDVAVENITWEDRKTMKPGTYKFGVVQFSGRGVCGFRAEIEFDGNIYRYDYSNPTRSGERVDVAEVTLDDKGNFSIKELLPSSKSSKEVWGLSTNQFIPVSVVCYSPNYWDEQNGIGHKHYFFMLKDCVNPEMPNGFYNEFLKPELEVHKRVFEALGSKMHVEDVDDQLSGIGFSSTKRAELVVKVKGQTERVLKVMF